MSLDCKSVSPCLFLWGCRYFAICCVNNYGFVVFNSKYIFFFEEGVRSGGIAEKFAAELLQRGYKGGYDITAVEDCFVKQAKVPELIKDYGFDSESMVDKIVKKTTEV